MVFTPTSDHDRPFQFELQCPVETPMLRILRRLVHHLAQDMHFDDEEISKIEMAVDEACSNVMRHAYPKGAPMYPPSALRIQFVVAPQELTIHVHDRGCGAPRGVIEGACSLEDYQNPERDRYWGLGTLVMKCFMDEVCFASQAGAGTTVTLKKRRKQPATTS